MRPLRLTMQAFGPFAGREVVDFRAAAASGLFGVYGPTGSGKSTIFSALTFALFGEPAREEQEPRSLRSDLSPADLPTEVELVFDIGPKRYVMRRAPEQMRPAKRGGGETKEAHKAFLFDATGMALEEIDEANPGKVIAEKKVKTVNDAAKDLLGYGPEQFRRIVLLPQGRFEAFLAADSKDRLKILKDLFDVSLYSRLARQLKEDAAGAEREVREARAVCAGRLQAEGFESVEALAGGIEAAGEEVAALKKAEAGAGDAAKRARGAAAEARRIEGLFAASETAAAALAGIAAKDDEVAALEAGVQRAAKAAELLDVETARDDAAQEAQEAQAALEAAEAAAEKAAGAAAKAAGALDAERAKAPEREALRAEAETLARHAEVLEAAAGLAQEAAAAEGRAKAARDKAGDAEKHAQEAADARRAQDAALAGMRKAEAERARLSALCDRLAAQGREAAAQEKATAELAAAQKDLEAAEARHAKAEAAAKAADAAHDAAERALSAAQAQHLAASLEPGAPCPVCGGCEHPAPARGAEGHAGLDAGFRKARAARDAAQHALAQAAGALDAARRLLQDRQERLAGLEAPGRPAEALRAEWRAADAALKALGPAQDVGAAEARLSDLAAAQEAAEGARDAARAAASEAQAEAAAAAATLKQALSAAPEALRDPAALEAARAKADRAVAEAAKALETAETAERTAREAALTAAGAQAAARTALAGAQGRAQKAAELFAARLSERGLDAEAYAALKPKIATLDADRAAVEAHRTARAAAAAKAEAAAQAVAGQERPDLPALETAEAEAEAALKAAADARAAAETARAALIRLREALAEELARLDRLEEETGPLRGLAALCDAGNDLRMDLETYAIGAMFDRVLAAADRRLQPMSACRYRLRREEEATGGRARRGLGIEVFDLHTGRARPTATLSGGETFIAALALALGLADVVESAGGKVRLDTIFIDEGFGSLDAEDGSGTLEQVLQALEDLAGGARAVGLISHVPLVQEAAPNGFYVRKTPAGSKVERRGA
ncbi:AAA family ATPase [Rhodovulum sp. DZ06]|uniref:AAA family ATPase n=1 Tax=Rhodovulum sp. DZ06 TaxID=3425126 RepID=UPI003D33F62C